MKTKIEILKDLLSHTVHVGYSSALQQAIEALDNPLGVLPGDEILVWDRRTDTPRLVNFARFDKNASFPWHVHQSPSGRKYAKLPEPEPKTRTLTSDNVHLLKNISHGLTSLHDQLEIMLKDGV